MQHTAKLQQQFKAAILARDMSAMRSYITPCNSVEMDLRARTYQNNVFMSLMDVLQSTFPTVCDVIGDEAFRHVARDFIRAHPPSSGCLYEYGDGFPDFIENVPQLKSLPYLSDVAHLDWARHQVYYEADSTPFEAAQLSKLGEKELLNIVFTLPEAIRLVESRYNLQGIWAVSYENYDGQVNVNECPAYAMLVRPSMKVELYWVKKIHFDLIEEISKGKPIGNILEQLATVYKDKDLQQALAFLLSHNIFTNTSKI